MQALLINAPHAIQYLFRSMIGLSVIVTFLSDRRIVE